VTQIREPSVTPYNFRAPDVFKVRDDATIKITTGEQKAEPGFMRDINRQMQAILDLPRP
jgi:hypothetical protein